MQSIHFLPRPKLRRVALAIASAAMLASSIAVYAQGAVAPEAASALCRATCEADKKQCQSGQSKADPTGVATTVGVIALALTLPQARTPVEDPYKTNPLDKLDADRRADREARQMQKERDGQCNHGYMQCLGACQ